MDPSLQEGGKGFAASCGVEVGKVVSKKNHRKFGSLSFFFFRKHHVEVDKIS